MKISYIVTLLSSNSPGSFFRPYEIAKNVQALKNSVSILTPFKEDVENYREVPLVEIPNVAKNQQITGRAYNSVRSLLKKARLSRLAPYDSYILSWSKKIADGIEKSVLEKPDLIQGEQEAGALAALIVGKKLGVPVIADIHNIWPEELAAAGYIKDDSDTFRNLMKIEQKIIDDADGLIAVNDFMKDYLINKFDARPNKIVVVPPGGNVLFDKNEDLEKKSKEKKIIYSGLVNPNAHVDLFVKSIPYVYSKHPNSKFIISEKGTEITKIKNLCKSLPTQPEFYWFQAREKARTLIQSCYLGMLPSSNDIGRKLGTPLKLLEYMSFGIPIVANDIGSWSKLIDDEKIGILTDDDPQEFANGICSLIEDENMYRNIQSNMLKLIKEKFNWRTNVERILLPFYEKLV